LNYTRLNKCLNIIAQTRKCVNAFSATDYDVPVVCGANCVRPLPHKCNKVLDVVSMESDCIF